MIKKIFLLTLIIGSSVLWANANNNLSNSLKNCSTFNNTGTINTGGIEATYTKKILGWNNNKCQYQEKINMMGINSTVNCRFTMAQIKELTSVMDAYETIQNYTGESPDLSNIDAAQNNPVAKSWNKYLQDSSVCSISTDQQL